MPPAQSIARYRKIEARSYRSLLRIRGSPRRGALVEKSLNARASFRRRADRRNVFGGAGNHVGIEAPMRVAADPRLAVHLRVRADGGPRAEDVIDAWVQVCQRNDDGEEA